jgi:TolB-like protein
VVLSAGVALAAAVGAVWWSTRGPSRCRLAIMPFSTDTMSAALASDATAVGEQVLFEVTRAMGDDADVLGPRTTGPALASGASLPEIAEQLDVTHVVNVKHMGDGHTPRLLVELIRVHDGRHVWVERLDRLDDDTATALSRGIVAELSR